MIGWPEITPYRPGIFEENYDGIRGYEHGGFWGALVMFEPDSGTVIAGATLQQKNYKQLKEIMLKYLAGDHE